MSNAKRYLSFSLAGVLTLALAACGSDGPGASSAAGCEPPDDVPILADEDMITRGPNGETPVAGEDVTVSEEQADEIREGGYTAALIWDAQTPWFDAVSRGATETFEDLGIEVIAQTQYGFDLAEQRNQVETVMGRNPDILLTIAGDPVASGQALQPAVDAGVKIVLLSTMVEGWTAGEEYVGMVTGDQAEMGALTAEALADAIGGEGEVGVLFHDANYFVTNRRDQVLVSTLAKEYPNICIVSEQGFTTPDQAEELTSAMLVQNPEMKGLYAAWDAVTENAMSAVRAADRDDLAVVSMDLGTGTAQNLASGGQIEAIAIEQTYQLGVTMARKASLAMIGAEVPPFSVVPAVLVTEDNIVDVWREAFRTDPPDEVMEAAD